MRLFMIYLLSMIILVGCANSAETDEWPVERTNEQIKFSTVNNSTGTNQQPANQAKETIASSDILKNIYAVNSTNKLLIALDVNHHHRLQLKQIREDIKMELTKVLPEFELHVSTDQKIQHELEELEKELRENNITSFHLQERVEEILSLSKEQT